jgi:hypothetical protein
MLNPSQQDPEVDGALFVGRAAGSPQKVVDPNWLREVEEDGK